MLVVKVSDRVETWIMGFWNFHDESQWQLRELGRVGRKQFLIFLKRVASKCRVFGNGVLILNYNGQNKITEKTFLPVEETGMTISVDGAITEVAHGSQAEIKGVQEGWKVAKVNGKEYLPNLLVEGKAGNEPYNVLFRSI